MQFDSYGTEKVMVLQESFIPLRISHGHWFQPNVFVRYSHCAWFQPNVFVRYSHCEGRNRNQLWIYCHPEKIQARGIIGYNKV
jgi:hypothetical protein